MASPEEPSVHYAGKDGNQEADRAILNYINNALRGTRPWTRLISILGFVAVAIMILAGIGLLLNRKFFPMSEDTPPLMLIGTINFAVSILYLIPSVWLYKYSSAISRFLKGGGAIELGNALIYQKSFWKFVGILTLISLVIAALGLLASIFLPTLLFFRD